MKVSPLDVGRPYSYMVTRLLAAHHSVVLGLRRQHEVLPGAGMRRGSATAEWRSLLGLGAQARLVEAALGGSYKPKEVWLTVESVSLGWESGKKEGGCLIARLKWVCATSGMGGGGGLAGLVSNQFCA